MENGATGLARLEYVFLDGRESIQSVDGVSTSGSVAVRRDRTGKGLSIVAIEAADKIAIGSVRGRRLASHGLASVIDQVGKAGKLAIRVFDAEGRELSNARTLKTAQGWEIAGPKEARRYEVTIGR